MSLKWWIASEGPNQMPETSQSKQKSYDMIREQIFSTKFVEDEQCFKEFWPFYLNSKIIDPPRDASRESLVDSSNDEEGP